MIRLSVLSSFFTTDLGSPQMLSVHVIDRTEVEIAICKTALEGRFKFPYDLSFFRQFSNFFHFSFQFIWNFQKKYLSLSPTKPVK